MSLYDKASIALIPSGTKASKLYSVLPANGNGDFTHSRGSTATRINKDGLIESVANNVPRLDYPLTSGVVGDCPHLLLEPQRTNSILYSNGFDDSSWSKGTGGTASAPTVTANQGTSPDGSNNAYKIVFDLGGGTSSSDRSRLTQAVTGSSSTSYAFSFYAKAFSSTDVGKIVNFSVDNVSNENANFTLTSEFQRFTFIGTSTGTTINQHIQLRGNLSTSDSVSMLLFGYQMEESSYVTSYIPTTNSAITRSADACNGSGTSADINSEQGVFFAEIAALSDADLIHRRITLSDASTSNVIRIAYDTGSQRITVVVFNGGSNQCVFQATSSNSAITDVLDFNKVALSFKENEFKCFINGTQFSSTDTSGNTFSANTLTELAFDNGGGGNVFLGKCKQLIVFNEAFTDAELTTLTT
tara:strand:+ start:183 stop:1424 length:1242 start_codon:yes stop_codon:yes gene_type:complete